MKKNILMVLTVVFALTLLTAFTMNTAWAKDPSLKEQIEQYKQTTDKEKKKELFLHISKTVPETQEDANELRKIFAQKEWDADLFAAGIESLKKIKDASLDEQLIEILNVEKPFIEKYSKRERVGKTEQEDRIRSMCAIFIISKLAELKSQKAIPILKEYLNYDATQYLASEALIRLGDKSASDQIKEKMYEGKQINYGGLGLEEAINLVNDLQDKSKKDKWNKIAQQLINIRHPEAKPYLKKLFSHEINFVRWDAAIAFSNLVNINDKEDIIIMSKNPDSSVRYSAIHAMMNLRDVSFENELINILVNDPEDLPRATAAKAIACKNIQKGITYLEKAINDKSLTVRKQAFIALYILTEKKYEFKGKTEINDREAERIKRSPCSY